MTPPGDDHLNAPSTESAPGTSGKPEICDFCRNPIVGETISLPVDDTEYTFCTQACCDELQETDAVFTQYHGFRRIDPGVAGLREGLPEGIPRNSFVLISGAAGTRGEALEVELVWRTLQRNEPAVVVTFTEPPISLVQRFLDLGWNVLPALETDSLRIVDCFTSRIGDPSRFHRRLNRWNRHLLSKTESSIIIAEFCWRIWERTRFIGEF